MGRVVVALGTFDGVHLGHQAVLSRAVEEGERADLEAVAATFDPHPRSVLNPDVAPELLTTLELRQEALLRYGANEVRVIQFNEELSKKTPEEFVEDVLLQALDAEAVVVGENFRFGHRAAGDTDELERLMRLHDRRAIIVPIEEVNGGMEVNSTRIRALISAGDVDQAKKLLGRPYVLRGEVTVGDKRGRTIGFPTANAVPHRSQLVPDRGVYAGFVRVGQEYYAACTNIGVAPTFARDESKVEAYLLDFEGDLYGKVVDVGFIGWIRAERRFSGIEDLKEQITRDVEEARSITPDTSSGMC